MSVWYDDYELRVGDSLRRSIDQGLAQSRYGVVVLSNSFFSKRWTQYELDGLVERDLDRKVILPIWHRVDHEDVARYSPALAGKVAIKSSQGIEAIVASVQSVLNDKPRSGRITKVTAARSKLEKPRLDLLQDLPVQGGVIPSDDESIE